MREILGVLLLITSALLAFYNTQRTEKKAISGTTLTLIYSTFVGLALILGLNFNIMGFDSSQLDKKVAEADAARAEAIKAQELAEEALKETKKIYGLSLIRTGLMPSDESSRENLLRGKTILKSIYKDEYNNEIKKLMDEGIIQRDESLLN